MITKDEDDDGQAVPLQLANVIGIFYVLIGGSLFAVLYAIFSLLANIYHRTLKYKVCEIIICPQSPILLV